jgi:drug/metabolite transporter (DMT)-like permease
MSTNSRFPHPRWRILFLVLDFAGLAVFLLGLQPWIFGLDRSPVVGYLQVVVFLVGLACVVLSTYAIEKLQRPPEQPVTIREDVGARLAATGYVLVVVSGTADLIGLGSHPLPGSPHLGTLQSIGLIIGTVMIVLGFAMYYPRKNKPRPPDT